MRNFTASCLASGLALAVAGPVGAQTPTYPNKPIKVLVGSPPGAPSDVLARVLSERLAARFKQPVVVENRPGVGNSLAASQTAKAAPDGYTLLVSPDTIATVNPLVYRKLDFNVMTDLVPVSLLASFSQMLVCGSQMKLSTVADLVAFSKKNKVTYASGGPGSPGHLAAELFINATGTDMTHVPYKGPGPATSDVVAGHVNCGFLATPVVLPHVKSGRLTALTVSSANPSPLAPDVPTLAKATGKPQLEAAFNQYLFVPKDTPAAVVSELERAAVEAFKNAGVQSKLSSLDLSAVASNADAAAKTLNADVRKWEPVVKRMDLQLEE